MPTFGEQLDDTIAISRLAALCAMATEVSVDATAERQRGQPGAGSAAATDLDDGPEKGSMVGRLAMAWTMHSAEMLAATATILDQGLLVAAPRPLQRTVLEHASRVAWVLDANADQSSGDRRVRRAWLEVVVSTARDAREAESHAGPSAALAGAPDRDRKLRKETVPRLFGAKALDDRNRDPKKWSLVGEKRPGYGRAVRDFVARHYPGHDGDTLYAIHSMLGHPTYSGAFAASSVDPAAGVTTWVPTAESVVPTSLSVLLAWGVANRLMHGYLGWPHEDLDEWLRRLQEYR